MVIFRNVITLRFKQPGDKIQVWKKFLTILSLLII